MIRLQRVGRKNEAMFRLLVTQKHKGPKSGAFIELIGSYNPKLNEINFKEDRVKHWISKGAQPSDTVHNLLIKKGIIKGKTVNVLPKKTPIVKETEETIPETPAPTEDAPSEETVEEKKVEETPVIEEVVVEEVPEDSKKEGEPAV